MLGKNWLLLGLGCGLAFPLALPAPSVKAGAGQEIGFRVIERHDASRASKQYPKGRPIQIAFWYPAVPASASPAIVFRDYVEVAGRETFFDTASRTSREEQAVAQYRLQLSSAHLKPEETDTLLGTRMQAFQDAPAAPGRYPLILIAPGNDQSAHDQAFLAEDLASRGYVVAAVPSASRIGSRMTKEAEIPALAEAQAADLAVALRTARFEPVVRAGKYGVVAHSFGARSALLLAMGDSDVAALVSLDGGIGARAGKGWLEKARGFNRARATAPILHLYEETDKNMVPDFDLLRSLDRSTRYVIRIDAMAHAHFSSVGAQVATVPALARASSADSRTSDAWNAVVSATASFLDHFVSNPGSTKRSAWDAPASPLLHPVPLQSAPAASPTPMPKGNPAHKK
jgi:dienelactone hydrolase